MASERIAAGRVMKKFNAKLVVHLAALRTRSSNGGVGYEREVIAEERTAYYYSSH